MIRKMMLAAAVCAVLLTAAGRMQVSAQSVYTIGSVSKMYVTTAAMQLAEQGKLDLDAPVQDYLPEFETADPRCKDITVRMLMNHSSGLMGTSGIGSILLDDRSAQFHDTFLDCLRQQRLKADPGAYSCYCNDGFTLLEQVVERVSGMDFSDYLAENICKPLGLTATGTLWNQCRTPDRVDVQLTNGVYFAPEYLDEIGSGGLLASAEDVSRFGAQFFTGNETLLSDASKREMRKNQAKGEFEDQYGLGWDFVSFADYDAQGVQLLSKGGSVLHEHAELLVAPDQNISVSVLSSTGSSMMNLMMAQALMDIALEEQGITVTHSTPQQKTTLSAVPESYRQYEGLYGTGGEQVCRVTFPDMAYMQIENLCVTRGRITQYLYTDEDCFVRMEGSVTSGYSRQDPKQQLLYFRQRGGRDYICEDSYELVRQIGAGYMAQYALQRLEANPVDAAAQQAWDARSDVRYYIYNEPASGALYLDGGRRLHVTEGYAGNAKILDADRAVSAMDCPGSTGRDLHDYTAFRNAEGEFLQDSNGTVLLSENSMPVLPADLSEVPLRTQQAVWYIIGQDTANRSLTLSLPEGAAVHVFDRYDNLIWSSKMLSCGDAVPLPAEGKIVFLGMTGGSVTITS